MKYFDPFKFDVYVFDVDECILRGHSLIIISFHIFKKYLIRNPLISLKFFLSGTVLYLLKILNIKDFQKSNKILLSFFMFGLKGSNVKYFLEGISKALNKVEPEFYEFLERIGEKKLIFISFGIKNLVESLLEKGFKSNDNFKIFSNTILIVDDKILGFKDEVLWRREDKLNVLKSEIKHLDRVLMFGHSENELKMCEFLKNNNGTCVGIGNVKKKHEDRFDLIFKDWKEFMEVIRKNG